MFMKTLFSKISRLKPSNKHATITGGFLKCLPRNSCKFPQMIFNIMLNPLFDLKPYFQTEEENNPDDL